MLKALLRVNFHKKTLFLIYINDLPDKLICDLVIYAEDTTLYSCLGEKAQHSGTKIGSCQFIGI